MRGGRGKWGEGERTWRKGDEGGRERRRRRGREEGKGEEDGEGDREREGEGEEEKGRFQSLLDSLHVIQATCKQSVVSQVHKHKPMSLQWKELGRVSMAETENEKLHG